MISIDGNGVNLSKGESIDGMVSKLVCQLLLLCRILSSTIISPSPSIFMVGALHSLMTQRNMIFPQYSQLSLLVHLSFGSFGQFSILLLFPSCCQLHHLLTTRADSEEESFLKCVFKAFPNAAQKLPSVNWSSINQLINWSQYN